MIPIIILYSVLQYRVLHIHRHRTARHAGSGGVASNFGTLCVGLLVSSNVRFLFHRRIAITLYLIGTSFKGQIVNGPFISRDGPNSFLRIFRMLSHYVLDAVLPRLCGIFGILSRFVIRLLRQGVFRVMLTLGRFFRVTSDPFVPRGHTFRVVAICGFPVLPIVFARCLWRRLEEFTLAVRLLCGNRNHSEFTILRRFAVCLVGLYPSEFRVLIRFRNFPIFSYRATFKYIPALLNGTTLSLRFNALSICNSSRSSEYFAILRRSYSSSGRRGQGVISLRNLVLFIYGVGFRDRGCSCTG